MMLLNDKVNQKREFFDAFLKLHGITTTLQAKELEIFTLQ